MQEWYPFEWATRRVLRLLPYLRKRCMMQPAVYDKLMTAFEGTTRREYCCYYRDFY